MVEKEYFSREDVMKAVSAVYYIGLAEIVRGITEDKVYNEKLIETIADAALEVIKVLPATVEDVAPVVHGYWIGSEDNVAVKCSECQTEFYIQDLEEIGGDEPCKYCPNCGARMDGDENDP